MAAKRSIMRINVESTAISRLDEICHRRGMTQISCSSRLVSWFCDQDDHIQNAILRSHTAASIAPVTRLLLKSLSSAKLSANDEQTEVSSGSITSAGF